MSVLNGRIIVSSKNGVNCELFSTYPFRFVESNKGNSLVTYICLLGFGGGNVSGDSGNFYWVLKPDSTACFCTQGTTKIFKQILSKHCIQIINCELEERSLLCYAPDSTALLKESSLLQYQTYFLHSTASLVLVDWYTSGRMHMNEWWSFKALDSRIEIFVDTERVFLDHIYMNHSGDNNHKHFNMGNNKSNDSVYDTQMSMSLCMGNYAAFGVVLLLGPKTEITRNHIDTMYYKRQSFEEHQQVKYTKTQLILQGQNTSNMNHNQVYSDNNHNMVSVSHLLYGYSNYPQSISVVRFGASSTEKAYQLLYTLLSPLQDTLSFIPYDDRLFVSH